jgi:hypothetical protein
MTLFAGMQIGNPFTFEMQTRRASFQKNRRAEMAAEQNSARNYGR